MSKNALYQYENCFYDADPPEFRRDAWYGLIFRWYGVDAVGNIAVFQTGELPIPKAVFADEDAYRKLDLYFRGLPRVTKGKVAEKVKELRTVSGDEIDYSDYLAESAKGLFCIDEIDTYTHRKKSFGYIEREEWYGYYLTTIPENPLNIKDLPGEISRLLESYYFPLEFSDAVKVIVTKYLDCE